MKDINNYILEKLHINKDFKRDGLFDYGDTIGCIIVTESPDNATFQLIPPQTFIKLEGKTITYKTDKNNEYEFTDVYVNSNGYYEGKVLNDSGKVVCVPPSDMLDILKFWDEDKNVNKRLYENYFDKSDKFIIEKEFERCGFQDSTPQLIEDYSK